MSKPLLDIATLKAAYVSGNASLLKMTARKILLDNGISLPSRSADDHDNDDVDYDVEDDVDYDVDDDVEEDLLDSAYDKSKEVLTTDLYDGIINIYSTPISVGGVDYKGVMPAFQSMKTNFDNNGTWLGICPATLQGRATFSKMTANDAAKHAITNLLYDKKAWESHSISMMHLCLEEIMIHVNWNLVKDRRIIENGPDGFYGVDFKLGKDKNGHSNGKNIIGDFYKLKYDAWKTHEAKRKHVHVSVSSSSSNANKIAKKA